MKVPWDRYIGSRGLHLTQQLPHPQDGKERQVTINTFPGPDSTLQCLHIRLLNYKIALLRGFKGIEYNLLNLKTDAIMLLAPSLLFCLESLHWDRFFALIRLALTCCECSCDCARMKFVSGVVIFFFFFFVWMG